MGAVEEQARSDFPHRWTITNEAKAALLHIYNKTQYPSTDFRRLLADQLGVSIKQVQVWFRNQPAREKSDMDAPDASIQSHAACTSDVAALNSWPQPGICRYSWTIPH
eukprot:6191461-Pleurochrysis_carterae.AAC.1